MDVDDVFDLLFTRKVAAFGYLSDCDSDAEVRFAPVSDHFDSAYLSHRVGVAVFVFAVV